LFANEHCPNAERIARRGFYLPSGVGLTEAEADESSRALLVALA
jgi:perosamine synthetase